jgi:hypothetical protein
MVILASAIFKTMFENPKLVFKEEPLYKNKEFQLRPGEQYKYSYVVNSTEVNFTYAILGGGNCIGIRVIEEVNNTPTCVDKWGVGRTGSNVTFENPSIIFFKPWMLALNDTWKWNNSMCLSLDGNEKYISTTYYRVIRRENYSNRETYVVEVMSASGPAEYDWIDVEKRIALKIVGDGYEIRLIG